MASYYVPAGEGTSEVVEKRSRFLGYVWRVASEEEARARIAATRTKHYDARHNCWCYRLHEGGVDRWSDDGEPQGSAGQPMLEVLRREGVEDVCCVVTRWARRAVRSCVSGRRGRSRAPTRSSSG